MSADRTWHTQAACDGMASDLFYVEKVKDAEVAKGVCAGCPVAADCLKEALTTGEEYGIWGGLTSTERRRIGKPKPARSGKFNKFDDATISRIHELAASGMAAKAIARVIGCVDTTVLRYIGKDQAA